MEKTIVTRKMAQSIKNWAWKGPCLEVIFQKVIEAARNQQDHCILEFRDYNYALEQKTALEKYEFTTFVTRDLDYSGFGCIYLIVNWEE